MKETPVYLFWARLGMADYRHIPPRTTIGITRAVHGSAQDRSVVA